MLAVGERMRDEKAQGNQRGFYSPYAISPGCFSYDLLLQDPPANPQIHYLAPHMRCCGAGTAADTE